MRRILGILGAVALAGGAAMAQTAPLTGSTDQSFVQQAYSANLGEVKLGELAQTRGQAQAVKDLGRQMVSDHQVALDELRRAAQKDGMSLPSELDPQTKQAYERLSQLSGRSFDMAYLDHLKNDHQQAISLFQNEADRGKMTNLKQYAKKTLPTLQAHADVVRMNQKQLMQQPQPSSTPGMGMPPATTTPGESGTPPGSIEVHPTQQPAQPAPPM